MRDPVPTAALPRAPDQGQQEGLRVPRDRLGVETVEGTAIGAAQRLTALSPKEDGIRCPNRKCRKKLAEDLQGTLTITCRHCGHRVMIRRD